MKPNLNYAWCRENCAGGGEQKGSILRFKKDKLNIDFNIADNSLEASCTCHSNEETCFFFFIFFYDNYVNWRPNKIFIERYHNTART